MGECYGPEMLNNIEHSFVDFGTVNYSTMKKKPQKCSYQAVSFLNKYYIHGQNVCSDFLQPHNSTYNKLSGLAKCVTHVLFHSPQGRE